MNRTLNCIFARRSVRSYRPEPVPDALIQDMLEAAMAAPSACAKDPWRFVVVRDKRRLAAIAAGLPNGQMLKDAALGIVVCGDIKAAHANEVSYLIQDCSAAMQNLLLAASMLGLGACWLGVHPREDRVQHLRQTLRLPEHIIPVGIASIGSSDEHPEPRTRFKKEMVHHDIWSQ